jgi:hypothetical protein
VSDADAKQHGTVVSDVAAAEVIDVAAAPDAAAVLELMFNRGRRRLWLEFSVRME